MVKRVSRKAEIVQLKQPAKEKPPWILVSENVQLQDVRLIDCDGHIKPEATKGKRPCQIEWATEVQSNNESRIAVIARFSLQSFSESDPKKSIIDIGASFLLIYRLIEPKDFGEDVLKQFADANSVFNAWPYWRELAQSLTTRMGLPPLVIPVWRIGTPQVQPRKSLPAPVAHSQSAKK